MAEQRQKRPRRRSITPRQDQDGDIQISSSGARIRITPMTIGLLVVAVLAVIAFMLPREKAGGPGGAPGPAAPGVERAADAAGSPRESNAPVITRAEIVPPNPAAATPLGVVYDVNSGGDGLVSYSFRWYVDNALVQDGPTSALQTGSYRKGASVYAEVTPSDQSSTGSAFATPAVVIVNMPPEVTAVALAPGNAAVGEIMSASPSGSDPDGDPVTYTYQWQVNGNPVGSPGDANTFSTAGLRKNDIISAAVNYTDGEAGGGPVFSNSIVLQNRSPKITSTAPLELASGLFVYQVMAKDPDGDTLTYRLNRLPSGMTIDASSGLIRWQLNKNVMFTGRNEAGVNVTVDDGDGGTDTQEFSIVFTDLYVN